MSNETLPTVKRKTTLSALISLDQLKLRHTTRYNDPHRTDGVSLLHDILDEH